FRSVLEAGDEPEAWSPAQVVAPERIDSDNAHLGIGIPRSGNEAVEGLAAANLGKRNHNLAPHLGTGVIQRRRQGRNRRGLAFLTQLACRLGPLVSIGTLQLLDQGIRSLVGRP